MFTTTLISCFGAPLPASIVLVLAGALATANGQPVLPLGTVAFAAAIVGGTTLYLGGRTGGAVLLDRLKARAAAGAMVRKAERLVDRHGSLAVFLGASLVSPAGPLVMLISGLAGLGWRPFLLWQIAGQMIWVGAYVLLGAALSDRLVAIISG